MAVLRTQGVHHITLNGADRQTSIDFWEGVLGMPFVFEQPNLDQPEINHLYFDPGDGRLITIFTHEERRADNSPNPNDVGTVHHLAFIVDKKTYDEAAERLRDAAQQDTQILVIALDAGFRSLSTFNKAFKASLSTTPTEYRRAALHP